MCRHTNYQASFDMTRLSGDDESVAVAYVGELMIRCKDCGVFFQFKGVPVLEVGGDPGVPLSPVGVKQYHGVTLTLPMEPMNEPTPTFSLPKKASVH